MLFSKVSGETFFESKVIIVLSVDNSTSAFMTPGIFSSADFILGGQAGHKSASTLRVAWLKPSRLALKNLSLKANAETPNKRSKTRRILAPLFLSGIDFSRLIL